MDVVLNLACVQSEVREFLLVCLMQSKLLQCESELVVEVPQPLKELSFLLIRVLEWRYMFSTHRFKNSTVFL